VDAIMAKLRARFVVSSEGFRTQAIESGHAWAGERIKTIDEIAALSPVSPFTAHTGRPEDTAFLQLTSGSTGLPRAVMIRNVGAIHNAVASSIAIGAPHGAPAHTWADAMVSWLPLYHDMGLIGCLMLPMTTGLDVWMLRPPTFLARPALWLKELGNRGTTFTPSPNFGYQLCVERIKEHQLADLDMNSWKAALTGAEMVRPETAKAFCEKFAACGFDPKAFVPCYGLAEGTLAVTFDIRGQGVRTLPAPAGTDGGFALAEVVSNGVPVDSTEVVIRSPNGADLGEGTIGEVTIKGPGTFQGYYLDDEATSQTMRDGWFATGDLGFLTDGELYLTGRTKDVLIVHGHNLMPDELERLADGVTGGGGLMRTAAFSVARGAEGEQAVLVVEIAPNLLDRIPALEQDIRSSIGRTMGLPLADVVFVKRGRIPRTSSGKMQRSAVRDQYLSDNLERLTKPTC
jgi:acyl-CoA synthetase (AMP-forming)/AMP-acid ligase II